MELKPSDAVDEMAHVHNPAGLVIGGYPCMNGHNCPPTQFLSRPPVSRAAVGAYLIISVPDTLKQPSSSL